MKATYNNKRLNTDEKDTHGDADKGNKRQKVDDESKHLETDEDNLRLQAEEENKRWNAGQYSKTVIVTNLVDALLIPNKAKFHTDYKVLDLGCGEGFATQRLTEECPGIEITAVDYSQSMVNSVSEKHIPGVVNVVQADAGALPIGEGEDYPIKPGYFDIVWSLSALHWVKNHKGLVKGMATALKPGGEIIAEFAYQSPTEVYSAISAVVGAEENANIPGITEVLGSDPWQRTTEKQWREELTANHFDKIEIQPHDRIQPLKGEDGMLNWLKMFAIPFFTPVIEKDHLLSTVESELRKEKYGLYNKENQENPWVVKYNRFSLYAQKER